MIAKQGVASGIGGLRNGMYQPVRIWSPSIAGCRVTQSLGSLNELVKSWMEILLRCKEKKRPLSLRELRERKKDPQRPCHPRVARPWGPKILHCCLRPSYGVQEVDATEVGHMWKNFYLSLSCLISDS